MKTMLIRFAAAALLVGLAAGCRHTGNETTPPAGTPGTVGFTDTPVTATGAMTTQVLTQTAQVFNLIDLAGGVAERASISSVLSGTYDRIRIVVTRGVLTW